MNDKIEELKRHAKALAILLDTSGHTESAIAILNAVNACDDAKRKL